jgi:septal ring factor EnvC (AmiA/AmiB activator)
MQTSPNTNSVPTSAADGQVIQQQVFLLEDTVMTMSLAVTTISRSMTRWEKIVFPFMVGFLLLAAYGFFLIYNLTKDIHSMSNNMVQLTMTVDHNMTALAQDVSGIHQQVQQLNQRLEHIDQNMSHIAISTRRMSDDMSKVAKPIGTMNNMVPWPMMP